jgi:hypothetical protein
MIDEDGEEGSAEGLPPESPAHEQIRTLDGTALARLAAGTGNGLQPTPLTGAIRVLQEAGVRGQSGMALLQVLTAQLEADLAAAREAIDSLRADLKGADTRYYEERTKVSVLQERSRSTSNTKWLQSGALTLGGVVGGIATPHLGDSHPGFAIGAIVLAAILLVVGVLPIGPKGVA